MKEILEAIWNASPAEIGHFLLVIGIILMAASAALFGIYYIGYKVIIGKFRKARRTRFGRDIDTFNHFRL